MNKADLAAWFFTKLGQDSGEFITDMIEAEMNPELLDIFNKFGGQLKVGDMDPARFQASLLIIGYLLRAHEDAKQTQAEQPVKACGGPNSSLH